MKDDKFSGDLQAWIEPELEARLVALILGEASAFEREELERLMSERPELAVFKRRLESIDGLVRESAKPDKKEDEDWKLGAEKRAAVMKVLGGPEGSPVAPSIPALAPEPRKFRWRRAVLVAAACVVFSAGLITVGMMGTLGIGRNKLAILEESATDSMQVTYESAVEEMEDMARVADSRAGWKGEKSQVPRAPSAPSSAMAKVNGGFLYEDGVEAPEPAEAVASLRRSKSNALALLKENLDHGGAFDGEAAPEEDAIANAPDDPASVDPFAAEGSGVHRLAIGGEVHSRRSREDAFAMRGASAAPGGIQPDPVPERALAGPVESDAPVVSWEMESVVEAGQEVDRISGDLTGTGFNRVHKTPAESNQPSGGAGPEIAIVDAVPGLGRKTAEGKGAPKDAGFSLDSLTKRKGITLGGVPQVGDIPVTGGLFQNGNIPPAPVTKPAAPAKAPREPSRSGGNIDRFFADESAEAEITEEVRYRIDTAKPMDIPGNGSVPPEPTFAFGDSDDFGSGWGGGGSGGGIAGDAGSEAKFKAGVPTSQASGEVPAGYQFATNSRGREGERANKIQTETGHFSRTNDGVFGIAGEDKKADWFNDESSGRERDGRLGALRDEVEEISESLEETEVELSFTAALPDLEKRIETNGKDLAYLSDNSESMMEVSREKEQRARRGEERSKLREDGEKAGINRPGSAKFEEVNKRVRLRLNELDGDGEDEGDEFQSAIDEVAKKRKVEKAAEPEPVKRREVPEDSAAETPFSTFSLHVSDVSFKLAQAALQKGQWPESKRVRTEEFVNAFDYQDPTPRMAEKVACQIGQAAHPYAQQRNLMRISMSTAALGRGAGTPLRLTVLLDNSGSMDRADRTESVRRAFALLAAQLNENDEVTLISFARTPRLLRDRVSGTELGDLSQVVGQLQSEGGTNLEAALQLGMAKAKAGFLEGAQNRVILLTDGAANLGNAEPDTLRGMIENLREQGIAFDACGVGADGLNDEILESLTRKGDGRYYFLDRPEDADAGFAKQIAGALRPAAQNVKVQVEFNPDRVGRYKLYGFEKHELKKEDFRNDSVDAAELAAEEAGVAVYQVEAKPDGKGPVGTVSVRFRDMTTGRMVERTWEIPYEAQPARLDESEAPVRLAGTAALFAERLKGTAVGDSVDLGSLGRTARGLQSLYPNQERIGQIIEMIEQARRLSE